jgi:3',5'-cyclic AMP phosphodiesterase CpdA
VRTLVHLSDLHFGRVDPRLLPPLVEAVRAARPHLVVVSGDLTQRAKRKEFAAAREFLERLPAPRIVVPGNHDVPLYNVVARFVSPLARYQRYITRDLNPVYSDEEIAVAGVNTARSLVIKNGRINHEQIDEVKRHFCDLPPSITKIIVTHHPFDLPAERDQRDLVGRANLAMRAFAECGADLLLAGHFHTGHADSTAARYRILGHAAVAVQAGTATSTRGRGEANSFNLITVAHPAIDVARHEWESQRHIFVCVERARFRVDGGVWRAVEPAAEAIV